MLIGEIVAAFGVRGQVKVRSLTDNPDYVRRRVKRVYVGPKRKEYRITEVFEHKPGLFVMSLEGVSSRTDAEDLRGSEVTIPEQQVPPLGEDEYFIHQLYNLTVVTEDGQELGKVREVLQTGANEVLVVQRPGQSDALIPVIRDVIAAMDVAQGRIVVRLIEGLLSD